MSHLEERYKFKRYAAFRSLIARRQWWFLVAMGLLVAGAAVWNLQLSFFLVVLLVFCTGCIGASISLLREFRKAASATKDSFKISQIGTDTHMVTGGVLALVFLLLISTGFMGGAPENAENENSPLISVPALPDLSGLNEDLRKDSEDPDERLARRLFTQEILDFQNLSILLFWSFLAGFSEGWVFGLLKKFTRDSGS